MKVWTGLLCAAMLSLATPLPGDDLTEATEAALADVGAATRTLTQARTARDRIGALTGAIAAFEAGLAALRESTRRSATLEAEIESNLAVRADRTAALLVALQTFATRPAPVLLLHPAGPAGSARAGLLLADIAPRLDGEAALLRADLQRLEDLRKLREASEKALADSLLQLQTARQELVAAVSNRGPLPRRFVNDPVREAILLASTETLVDFARGLDRIADTVAQDVVLPAEDWTGLVPLPVRGTLLRGPGEMDERARRPGILLETAPHALVTSPTVATLRYAGPLLDLGNVVILEPRLNVLFVFAGLGEIFATAGEVVEAGAPLGLMGDGDKKNRAPASTDGDEAGTGATDTLYIEVRQGNMPEDPGLWFQTDEDG